MSSGLLLKEEDLKEPSAVLNTNEIHEDIDLLVSYIENGYSGRSYLPGSQLHEFIAELNGIKTDSKLSPLQLCNKIRTAILKISDNHFWASLRSGKCEVPRFDYSKAIYLGKNINQDLNTPWISEETKVNNKSVSVFAFSYFPKWESKLWSGFETKLKNAVQKSKAIILDLRGNVGGSQGPPRETARVLYGQEPPQVQIGGAEVQTAEAKALLYNSAKIEITEAKKSGKKIEEFELKLLDEKFQAYEMAIAKPPAERDIIYNDVIDEKALNSDLFYKHPILVLYDEFCASSCEAMLLYLRSHPQVKLVGSRSGGFLQFGELGTALLKNSQIVVNIPTKFFRFKDGAYYEKIGISADEKISYVDAYKYALKMLKEKL